MLCDLHTHTRYSDGTLRPDELVALAASRGVDLLAITDHDSVDGLPAARDAARDAGIRLVAGVELSASWKGLPVHIVGLGIDPESRPLVDGLAENVRRRQDRAARIFDRLEARGIDLRDAVIETAGPAAPTRTHFARAMVASGLVPDMRRAFRRYLGKGKAASVKTDWPGIEEAVAWIGDAGGQAVLAHPLAYGLTRVRLRRFFEDFAGAGGAAVEVVTPRTDKRNGVVLATIARESGLAGSVGSDFHSPEQPWAMVGNCGMDMPLDLPPIWNNWDINDA